MGPETLHSNELPGDVEAAWLVTVLGIERVKELKSGSTSGISLPQALPLQRFSGYGLGCGLGVVGLQSYSDDSM